MNDLKIQEAMRLFERPQSAPTPTVSEYQLEQQRIRANYERLKAERLARETKRDSGLYHEAPDGSGMAVAVKGSDSSGRTVIPFGARRSGKLSALTCPFQSIQKQST
jgi:hypothetical protein